MPFTPQYLRKNTVPTIPQVKKALKRLDNEDAFSRDPRYFHAIVQALMFADAKALGVIQTRKLAVQKTPWRIGSREIAEDDERKQYLTQIIRNARLHHHLGSLLNARFTGAVLAEVNRATTSSQRSIRFIDFTDLEIDYTRPERVIMLDSNIGSGFQRLDNVATNRQAYIVATYNPLDGVKPNYRGGLMRSALPLLMLKHFDLWNWAKFNELFGQPVRYGQYDQEASKEDIAKAETMLEEMGSSAWAVIPDNVKLNFAQAAQSGSIQAYKDFQQSINETIAVLLLGQSETTETTPGRLGNDNSSEAVRADYQQDDWAFIENVINDEFLQVEWRLRYGGELPEEYRFQFDKEDPEDYEANANIVDVLLQNGVPLVKSNVENKTGLKIADEDTEEEDRLSGSTTNQLGSMPGPSGGING